METILSLYQEQRSLHDPEQPIVRWLNSSLSATDITWGMIEEESNRRTAFLRKHGCEKGDRVLILLQSSPEIWYFFFAAMKCGAVPCILFPNFGTEALSARFSAAAANFVVMDTWNEKYEPCFNGLTSLKQIFTLSENPADGQKFQHILCSDDSVSELEPTIEAVTPEDAAFMIFTSGTTGMPKAVVHRHAIATGIVRSMKNILQVQPDDVYWCTAHPAWITGTVYGILGPLLTGTLSIQYAGNYHVKRWMPILQDQGVTCWYSAPTAFRSMMKEPQTLFSQWDFHKIRSIFSIGEPLGAPVFEWGKRTFHREIMDTWFQTETGTIRIANTPGNPITPGAMGLPVDDAHPSIFDDSGHSCKPETPGRLMLKAGWETCFTEYYGQPEAKKAKFSDGYYDTGDSALIDTNGHFRFMGRTDDIINTAGHLIGPFEIESVLSAQEEIAEAAVTAAPDDLLYEKVAAFLVLKQGVDWTSELETKLRVAVNTQVSPYAVPKVYQICDSIPHTGSGKIDRAELKKKILER